MRTTIRQHSSRPLGNVDGLEYFHDLFYTPDQPNLVVVDILQGCQLRPSTKPSLWMSAPHGTLEVISSLTRKLTEEYKERVSQEVLSDIG